MDTLPETQAMASMTGVPAKSDSSPDTGQKMTPAMAAAAAKTVRAERTAKRRSPLVPVLMGALAVVVLAAVWWRVSGGPVSPSSAPAATATALPTNAGTSGLLQPPAQQPGLQPAQAGTSPTAGQSAAPAAASSKKEAAPQPASSRPIPAAASLPAPSQPPPVAVITAPSVPPAAVPVAPITAPAPSVTTPAPQAAVPAPQAAISVPAA